MERFLYVCPSCGLTKFHTKNNLIWCEKCNHKIQYLSNKQLKGIEKDFSFTNLTQWYDFQCDYVRKLDLVNYLSTPIDDYCVKVFKVILYKKKQLLFSRTSIKLFGDRIELDDFILTFDEISSITVLGKNKINVYYNDIVYQIKADVSFNGLKYVNIFHHYHNCKRGDIHEQFLGL